MNFKDAARSELARLPASSSFSQKAELLKLGRRVRQADYLLLLGTEDERTQARQVALQDAGILKRSADLIEGKYLTTPILSLNQEKALNAIYGAEGICRASAGWMLCDCLRAVHGVGMAVLCFSREPIENPNRVHIGKIIEADAERGSYYWEFEIFESLTKPSKLSSTGLARRLSSLLPQSVNQESIKSWAPLLGVELNQGRRGRPRKAK